MRLQIESFIPYYSSVLRRAETRAGRWKYFAGLVIPVLAVVSLFADGFLTFLTPAFFFLLVPTIELFLKPDHTNLDSKEIESRKASKTFTLLAITTVIGSWMILGGFLFVIANTNVSSIEFIGRLLSMGMVAAVAINVGHELGHRSDRVERMFGEAGLLISLENHFLPYHNMGHHKNVGTEKDAATARRGETYFLFALRSQWMSYVQAWQLETKRITRLGKSVIYNRMVIYTILQISLCASVFALFGTKVLIAFLISALIGKAILEAANYIEHYGLVRKKNSEGVLERVMPKHSWNSDHVLGRAIMFELSRHSDHHFRASKEYQTLESISEAPQLPTGYPGMMILALFPPVFFKVMDRFLDHKHTHN